MTTASHAAEPLPVADIHPMKEFYDELAALFTTLEETTGLEVCIYTAKKSMMLEEGGVNRLPHSFSSHFGNFCRIVKANLTGHGCAKHDSHTIVKKSAEIGKPFVNICHAGLAEVVFPIYDYNHHHIASVFIGQVITDDIDQLGFPEIIRRVRKLGVNEKKLNVAYSRLPRLSREKLLRIGIMADLAVRGLGTILDVKEFEHQLMLNQYPAIRQTLRLIADSSWTITEAEIAAKLKLHQSYLSRLFKRMMKCNFTTYMTKRRIHQAKMLLHHTEYSMMKIALTCGFARQCYFTRQFKKIIGITPLAYRKQNRDKH